MSHKIISFGEALWDLFPSGERFGGAPANFACHAANQGADVTMVSAVGADNHGQNAKKILQSYGVNIEWIQTTEEAQTGTVGVNVDDQGKPTFKIHQDAAWDRLEWNDELPSIIRSVDAVYFGTLAQRSKVARDTIRQAMSIATEEGIVRILDINLRPPFFDANLIRESIELATILKLSDDELVRACESMSVPIQDDPLQTLTNLQEVCGLDIAVMTCGAEGAILVSNSESIRQKGVQTIVQDTVGAGDAFAAAFLIGELSGHPRHESLLKACEIAAESCSHDGAVPEAKTNSDRQQI